MERYFLLALTSLYSIGGIITFLGYMPTIKDLRNKKPSANIKTYTMRSITALFSSLYGIFVLKDLVFIIVINLELLACVIIFILKLKLIYTQQHSNKRFSKNKKTIS